MGHGIDQWSIEPDHQAIERVLVFRCDLASNEVAHQNGNQGYRQYRCPAME